MKFQTLMLASILGGAIVTSSVANADMLCEQRGTIKIFSKVTTCPKGFKKVVLSKFLDPKADSELKGEKGDKGEMGDVGPQGLKGDKGEQGIQGDQGLQGAKGDKGETGQQGIQGIKGDKGEKGDQGLQGIKGNTGLTGATGATGARGDRGYTGPQGPQGAQGPQGIRGLQGLQGVKGDTGAPGSFGSEIKSCRLADISGTVQVPKGFSGNPYSTYTSQTCNNGEFMLSYTFNLYQKVQENRFQLSNLPTYFPLNSTPSGGKSYPIGISAQTMLAYNWSTNSYEVANYDIHLFCCPL